MSEQNLTIIAIILSGLALAASITAIILSSKLRKWRAMFNPESQPDNLEEVITSITDKLQHLHSSHTGLEKIVEQNGQILETAFRYSSVVRFNSGSNDGGNLSFALALLDGHQTGLIVTSMHGREHNRIYCKAIKEGQPIQPLNDEEQQALIEALTGKTKLKQTKPQTKTKTVKQSVTEE